MIRLDGIEGCREDVFVKICDIKEKKTWSEMVYENDDGSFTILINARLSYDGQREALRHGIFHITNGDFEKEDVQEIEAHAHKTETEDRKTQKARRAQAILEALKQEELEEDRKRLEQLRKEYHEYYLMEHARIQRELRKHERFMKTFREIHEDYFDILEQQYYDPDNHT